MFHVSVYLCVFSLDTVCGPPVDVVFVLDSSSSVGAQNFDSIKEYADILMYSMHPDTCDVNIGAMKYSSAAMIQFR